MGPYGADKVVPQHWRIAWLALALCVHLALTAFQLGLPGIHYDEAKEAGVNAMELLAGAPVTAFRSVTLSFFGLQLPVMVQDYIGALNVYLALPFLHLTGIGVPNLRALAITISLCTMVLLERSVSCWWCYIALKLGLGEQRFYPQTTPITLAGLVAVTLLAVAPSYVFWARQGIFVTNLTQPFYLLLIWQGLQWLRYGCGRSLVLAALAAGLALYAKLIAIWVVVPVFCLVVGGWVWQRRRYAAAPTLSGRWISAALAVFLCALAPYLYFNWQTGGTLRAILTNARTSYYGVDNLALSANLQTRSAQLLQVVRGEPFWYLGGVHRNALAPWLAGVALTAGLWVRPRMVALPLCLLGGVFVMSLFTISDLFVTHYALLPPLLAGVLGCALVGFAFGAGRDQPNRPWRPLVASSIVVVWVGLDLVTSVQYHRTLQITGGLADHSDASYHLAYHLRNNGYGEPLVLDWGIEAPVRYLSQGTVRPIELFGYESLAAPAPNFVQQLGPFLDNPANVYIAHVPAQTVFQGRRELFFAEAEARGMRPELERTFQQRDGAPVYELWRLDGS